MGGCRHCPPPWALFSLSLSLRPARACARFIAGAIPCTTDAPPPNAGAKDEHATGERVCRQFKSRRRRADLGGRLYGLKRSISGRHRQAARSIDLPRTTSPGHQTQRCGPTRAAIHLFITIGRACDMVARWEVSAARRHRRCRGRSSTTQQVGIKVHRSRHCAADGTLHYLMSAVIGYPAHALLTGGERLGHDIASPPPRPRKHQNRPRNVSIMLRGAP